MSGSNLFTGTLDLLILRTLEAAPLHGYAIGKLIRDGSEGSACLKATRPRAGPRSLLQCSRKGNTPLGQPGGVVI